LGPLIEALTSGNTAALSQVDAATPEIIVAAGSALQSAYAVAFSYVWAAAAAFTFVAFVGEFRYDLPTTSLRIAKTIRCWVSSRSQGRLQRDDRCSPRPSRTCIA
jgi:hypothetical protein